MNVLFREVDPFNCWIWIKFFEIPNNSEKNYINEVFNSWYVLGVLGGFNSENLQSHEEGNELSWMTYDNDISNSAMPSLMHNLGQMEYQNLWSRCWVDFGTSDAISIDILINTLKQVSNDYVKIDELIIGGENNDWSIDDQPDLIFRT
tara:strand:- start:10236 stop:10679 length:444 start_codon:yes stop_codon:yes gene_type:complete